MVGLPGQKIIPNNWAEFHRPTIEATFRSSGQLIRPGNPQGVRDWQSGRTEVAVPFVVYDGPVRIQSRGDGTSQGRTTTVADRILTIGSYLVALPTDSEPGRVGDLFEVQTVPDDPALNGLTLIVVEIPHADIAWQRNLGCDLYQPTIRG